jgi:hypothetical protein
MSGENTSLMGAVTPIIGAGAASLMGGEQEYYHQKRLMKQQQRYYRANQGFGHQLQKNLWDYTNVGNQVRHMENTGLSVGLMYGKGGQPGQTTPTPSESPKGGPGISGLMSAGIQGGLQAQAIGSQIDLNKAQAEKLRADAEKTKGVDTAETIAKTNSLTQGIENQKAEETLTKLQSNWQEVENHIKTESAENSIDIIEYTAEQSYEKLGIMRNEKIISNETYKDKIKIVQENAINANLQNVLTRSQINLNEEKVNQITQKILQDWQSLDNQVMGLQISNQGNKIRLMEHKRNVNQLKLNLARLTLDETLGFGKLNIEQQKIFMRGMENVLNSTPTTTTKKGVDGKGTYNESQTKTTKY